MKPEQIPFDLGHRAAFDREDFWVSESNKNAVAWLDKYPDWPAPALVIYGPPASGKTHLLQVFRKETGALEFPQEAIPLSQKTAVIDGADLLMGDPAREEAVLHLYNSMKERGGHILIAAASPQRGWRFVLPDLKSRLMAAPAVEVLSPDDQLMAVVLTKLFSDRQIFVPQDVVQFILPRVERSFSALRALVEAIDRKALAEKTRRDRAPGARPDSAFG
jgi:chromosomal replication initiation ATPase DnaA